MTDVAVEVLLPKIGLTMQEGTIDEWLVPTGAAVAEGDALLRLATDKVDVDVEAEAGGLFHPVVAAGATVRPGPSSAGCWPRANSHRTRRARPRRSGRGLLRPPPTPARRPP